MESNEQQLGSRNLTEFSKKSRCPCGSGIRYGDCCKYKSLTWHKDSDGNIFKKIHLSREHSQELQKVLKIQEEKFIKEFGRKPSNDDRIFFDIDQEDFDREWDQMLLRSAMDAQGLRPEIIHAIQQTDRIILPGREQYIADIELEEWDNAIQDFLDSSTNLPETLTLHGLAIESLKSLCPEIRTKKFRKVVRELLTESQAFSCIAYFQRSFKYIPDAYFIDRANAEVLIFEIEDTHLLTKDKLAVYLNLWKQFEVSTKWSIRIFVANRYAVIEEIDCSALYEAKKRRCK